MYANTATRLMLGAALMASAACAHAVAYFTINVSEDVDGNAAVCSLRAAFKNINTQSKDGIGGNNVNNPSCPKGELVNDIRFAVPSVDLNSQIDHGFGTVTMHNGELRGHGKTRLMRIAGDATTLILERMWMTGGNGNGGSGGAILVEGQANLTLRVVTFAENYADTDGGAIALMGSGKFTTFKALFRSNHAKSRGGALLIGGNTPANQPPAKVWASDFILNTAKGSGGAIECSDSGVRALVSLGDFRGNMVLIQSGIGEGGAISSYCDLDIETSWFQGNSVDEGRGGAVYSAGPTRVSDSYFRSNIAGRKTEQRGSGGAYFADAATSIRRSSFSKNTANDRGGALMIGDGASNHDVLVANTSFIDNEARYEAELRPGAAVWATGLSFPRKAFNPALQYDAFRFQMFNNTFSGNFGLDQLHFETGPQKEVLFVNNLMQHPIQPACGGDPARLQLTRPIEGAPATNVQYPGKFCDTASETMASLKIPMGANHFGGLLGQHFLLPSFADPATSGDIVICNGPEVLSEDQLGNSRNCKIGAVEKAQPKVFPPEF